MNPQLLTEIFKWARQQTTESQARLHAQIEQLKRDAHALEAELASTSPAQSTEQLIAERDALSAECAKLDTEVTALTSQLNEQRREWCAQELQRRAALLLKMHAQMTATDDARMLAQLDEVGPLLAENGEPYEWPSLPAPAKARVNASLAKGALARLFKQSSQLYAKVRDGIETLPELTTQLRDSEAALNALKKHLSMLKDAAAKDKAHGFQSPDLAPYYDSLSPDDAHRLLEESLDRLCKDAAIEIIHSRLHHRGELDAFLQSAPTAP